MAMVQCKNCGKRYRYEGGCCPNCGAFNRRPRRSTISADGEVHHMDDQPYDGVVPEHSGKKVCFEEEECFERQARHTRRQTRPDHIGATETSGPQGERKDPLGSMGQRPVRKIHATSSNQVIGITVVIAVLVALLPALIAFLSSAQEFTSSDTTWQDDPLGSYEEVVSTQWYVAPGETFQMDGDDMCLVDWGMTPQEDGSGLWDLRIKSTWDHDIDMTLCCWDDGGHCWEYSSISAAYNGEDDLYEYTYFVDDWQNATSCMLKVRDWLNDEIVWVVLPLEA